MAINLLDNTTISGTLSTLGSLSANKIFGDGSGLKNVSPLNPPYVLVTATSSIKPNLGLQNTASGNYSNIGGGYCNCAVGEATIVNGGICNIVYANNVGGTSIVGGGCRNCTGDPFNSSNVGMTIAGGANNIVSSNYGAIGGGSTNTAAGIASIVSGGCGNKSTGNCSSINGGFCNTASGYLSNVGAGYCNTASGQCASVNGGFCNNASGSASSILGGRGNVAASSHSVVVGGCCNSVANSFSFNAFIGGGCMNYISTNNAANPAILGGVCNCIGTNGANSSILGGSYNITQYPNTFLLGSSLTANQANFTYVQNLSSQGSIYGTYYGDGSNITGVLKTIPSSLLVTSLTAQTITVTQQLSSSGAICGSKFYGDGSNLTNVLGTYFPYTSSWNSNNIIPVNGGNSITSFTQNSIFCNNNINGGCSNSIGTEYGACVLNTSILGGCSNNVYLANPVGAFNQSIRYSSIVNGGNNCIYGNGSNYNTIAGGKSNTISSGYSFIAAGTNNCAQHACSFLLGYSLTSNQAGFTYVNNLSSQGSIYGTHYGDGSNLTLVTTTIPFSGTSSTKSVKLYWGNNTNSGIYSSILGGTGNNISGSCSFIGSGNNNNVSGSYGAIGAGQTNVVAGNNSFVGAGFQNYISGTLAGTNFSTNNSVIAGGCQNILGDNCTAIGGGAKNCVLKFNSAIFAGNTNTVSNQGSFIGAGSNNTVSGAYSVITGGINNIVSSNCAFIAGGCCNDTKGYANTFLIGSGLSANQANFTYVNNLSSQGSVYGKFYGDGSNITNVAANYVFNIQNGTSYTIGTSDNGLTVGTTNTSGLTALISSTTTYPVGYNVNFLQLSTGRITLSAENGFKPINQSNGYYKTTKQYSVGTLLYTGSTYGWVLFGDISA